MPHSLCRAALAALAVIAVLFAASDPAAAAGQRSFVSTSGVDNPNPCRSTAAVAT